MKSETPVALLLNDIHVSKENIQEFVKNWDEALSVCSQYDIKDIIIGGDLWHSRAAQTLDVLLTVRDAIIKAQNLDIAVVIAEGNHDRIDQESFNGYSHIFSGYQSIDVVNDYLEIDYSKQMSLWVMSYFPEEGSFVNRLDEIIGQLNPAKNNILYCHEGINGELSSPQNKELPAKIFKPFSKVLVGHYHDRKKIVKTNIEYIGASRQHNYGEDTMKGYTVLYSDGSTEFIQNQVNTRFYTLEATSIDEAKAILKDKVKSDAGARIKMRITCASDTASTIDKEALMELGATKVEVVAEASDSFAKVADFDTKYDKHGLKEEYSRFCKQKEINNIQLGLDYLDKIN